MKNFLKIIKDLNWYRQFVYGGILAAFFSAILLFAGFSLIWAILLVSSISAIREHYLYHLYGAFNWRNYFFLIVPVLLIYIVLNN